MLPLEFRENESAQSLGLDGSEVINIFGIDDLSPRKLLDVQALKEDNTLITFQVVCRLNSDIEIEYYKNDGILQYVLRNMIRV